VPRAPPPRPPTARPCGAKPRRSPRQPGRAISWPGCRGDLSISSADLSTSLSPPQACMGRCPDTMSGRGGSTPLPPRVFSYDKEGRGRSGGSRTPLPPPLSVPHKPAPPSCLVAFVQAPDPVLPSRFPRPHGRNCPRPEVFKGGVMGSCQLVFDRSCVAIFYVNSSLGNCQDPTEVGRALCFKVFERFR